MKHFLFRVVTKFARRVLNKRKKDIFRRNFTDIVAFALLRRKQMLVGIISATSLEKEETLIVNRVIQIQQLVTSYW